MIFGKNHRKIFGKITEKIWEKSPKNVGRNRKKAVHAQRMLTDGFWLLDQFMIRPVSGWPSSPSSS